MLIIGAGKMGIDYIKILIRLGIAPSRLVIVDIDPDREKVLREDAELMDKDFMFCTTMEEAFAKGNKFCCGFVLTNTYSHHKIIMYILDKGVTDIFVEKPLAIHGSAVREIESVIPESARIYTAFLINFSKAMGALIELMQREGLHVGEISSQWGKDRTGDSRSTPGDGPDETVHQLGVIKTLMDINQEVISTTTHTRMSYLPYADEAAQERARLIDPDTFPARVNSTTMIIQEFTTSAGKVFANIHSSYVMFEQTRRVEATLCDEGGKPTHLIKMDFDVSRTDILQVKKVGKGEKPETTSFTGDKVQDEVSAFLDVVTSGNVDLRLTGIEAAKASVLFTDEALLKGGE